MRFFILIAIVGGTLALFNPGQDDFATFIQERTQDVLGEATRDAANGLGGTVSGALGGNTLSAIAGQVAGALAGRAVERKNYGVFSTYKLDLDGPRQDNGDWTFLGVGGQFFELQRPRMLQR